MSSASGDLTMSSTPLVPPDSPGSSVSSTLQNEYEELLKYAVVIPKYDPGSVGRTLNDVRGSFPQFKDDVRQPASSQKQPYHRIQRDDEPNETESDEQRSDESLDSQNINKQAPYLRRQPSETTSAEKRDMSINQNNQTETPIKSTHHQFLADLVQTPDSDQSSFNESIPAYSPSVDPDIARIEHIIDVSSGELKRNLLAELSKAKIKVIEQGKHQLQKERERNTAEVNRLQNEIEGLKELLHTYEQSIERKDQVISNLTRGVQQQREKVDMSRAFADWKMKHIDHERQKFTSRLALNHYRHRLARKVWDSWHSIIVDKWKGRVEKACQSKAQEVCISLTNDYEARISSLEDALASAREEVNKLHREREGYEETMKKAFMRGVCALNLEAMNMFHEGENQGQGDRPPGPHGPHHFDDTPHVIPQEPVYSTGNVQSTVPRVVTSMSAGPRQTSTITDTRPSTLKAKSTSTKPRVLTAKVTARSDAPRAGQISKSSSLPMGLNPPMSSILVERHHPITKQTIGHATASRYPRQTESERKGSGKVSASSSSIRIVQ